MIYKIDDQINSLPIFFPPNFSLTGFTLLGTPVHSCTYPVSRTMWQQHSAKNHADTGRELQITFTDFSNFERAMVAGAR